MQLKYLAPGATGIEVKALQRAINKYGETLEVNGRYCERVSNAVKRAQWRIKEPINGIASISVQMKLGVVYEPDVYVTPLISDSEEEPKKSKK